MLAIKKFSLKSPLVFKNNNKFTLLLFVIVQN